MRYSLSISLFVLILAIVSPVYGDAGSVTGLWETQDKDGIIEIYPCENKICGRFYALKNEDPAKPSLDHRNPDPDKKSQPLCGMTFMEGFEEIESGFWDKGSIYSPRHGSHFSASLKIKGPEKMELHGYMFHPLFGETQIWTRSKPVEPCSKK